MDVTGARLSRTLDRHRAAFDKLRLRSDFFLPIRAFLMLSLSKHAGRWMPSTRFIMNFRELRAEFSTFTTRSYGKQAPHSKPFRGGFFAL